LVSFIVFLTFVPSLAGQVEIRVGNVAGQPGENIVVPIFFKNAVDVTAAELDLTFDSQLLSCPASSPLALPGELGVDHLAVGTAGTGSLHVTIYSPSVAPFRSSQGMITQVFLTISPSAQSGSTHALALSKAKVCSSLGEPIQVQVVNGTLRVGADPIAPEEGQNRLVFPQVANGNAGSGRFYTLLALLNRTNAPGRVRVRFCASGGSGLMVSLVDGASGSEFERDLPGAGTCLLQTDGQGTLTAGYAIVDSTAPLGGSGMFGWIAADGKMITEAGVGSSPGHTKFLLPILYQKGRSSTGLALANLSDVGRQLGLRLLYPSGKEAGSTQIQLGARVHMACFVHEQAMFPSLAGLESCVGVLEITGEPEVKVTALKQSFEEGLITTLSLVGVE